MNSEGAKTIMNLTAEQREQVRLSLLRYGLGKFTIGLARQYLISEGFNRIGADQVGMEIDYLEQKGLLVKVPKAVSPENHTWKTSAEGRDYLAEQGLA